MKRLGNILTIALLSLSSVAFAGDFDFRLNDQVKLYPNPTYTGIINLEIEQINPEAEVVILVYNLIGEQVYNFTYAEFGSGAHEVNLATQPQGTYFVNIVSNGEQVTRRIAIK